VGGFFVSGFLMRIGILETEVFNTFVENAVEKRSAFPLNHSARNASTHCTEARAGTFVVEL
jgi:hypothetical protein